MDELNLTLFTEYAATMDALNKAEAKIEALKPLIIAEIEKQGKDNPNYSGAFGTYSIKERRAWEYSAQLELAKEDASKKLKKMQATEQKDGIAKATVNKFLSFMPKEV